ncbi:16S rRNA (guanine(966)-N(2))-methyltransferase RsmD [Rivibacter subsaxonicus]|uniref:16S rRNA (Guanine(966)-N(2))-methyltransferase RsmD n=1 Tax=Rivibacter subsaxonicus TaxID=457575 RepID=A0A4Q7VGB7_9BURK|nr:16S rRNA (guanine(966)-N(2))-methyltransferase RsmD [Rivibacter subsaxonicus]RZT95060.1 16S rRNA (guanine(966)-N(2))-methyltransferase RsmD [Rivibacter subsaxonicus]
MSAPARPAAPSRPGEVRLIAGRYRRRKLPVADAPGLRPTPERVRETLFNWLGQDLAGWRVLDAFAGSGALGFEAASRGATEVLLLESDAGLARTLTQARQTLGASEIRIERADAWAWMARAPGAGFDLVLLDPPFGADRFADALKLAVPLVAAQGLIYLEADRSFEADPVLETLGLEAWRHTRAGAVHAHLLRRAAADA